MSFAIVIEKNVSMPEARRSKRERRDDGLAEVLCSMGVGDSFLYPRALWQRLNATMDRESRKDGGRKYSARAADLESLRVWRTA